jgi:hypothetical protein
VWFNKRMAISISRFLITALLAFQMASATATAQQIRRATPVKPGTTATQPSSPQAAPPAPVAQAIKIPAGPVPQQDLARFLAGLMPSDPYLLTLASSQAWQNYSSKMASGFGRLDMRALQKVRAFSAAQLSGVGTKGIFYPFSGPDFTYVFSMFPQARTYVLCGLEPVGNIPDLHRLQSGQLDDSLRGLAQSFKSLFDAGYFVTKDMRTDFATNPLSGTLPVLYVMLARMGQQIDNVEIIPQGVKLTFSAVGLKEPRTLYYLSSDLSNGGLRKSRLPLTLGHANGADTVYIKSASYLMHSGDFSTIRDALLGEFHAILQDDSGIPYQAFDTGKWACRFYGNYAPPLKIFAGNYQPALADVYRRGGSYTTLTFGVGYAYNPKTANLMLALRR